MNIQGAAGLSLLGEAVLKGAETESLMAAAKQIQVELTQRGIASPWPGRQARDKAIARAVRHAAYTATQQALNKLDLTPILSKAASGK